MPVLTEKETAALWVHGGGGSPADAPMAVAVANHESHRDTDAVNKASNATGIWQIHPGDPKYLDPTTNAKAAVGKHAASGWEPWSVCGSGPWSAGTKSCARLQPEANAIAKRLGGNIQASWLNALPDLTNPGQLGSDLGQGITGGGGLGLGIGQIAKAIADFAKLWVAVLTKLFDPKTWIDAGKIILGFVLLIVGVRRVFEITTPT